MLPPSWHKIFSDLWSNPLRSLLVVASITVGLFAIGTMSTIHFVDSADMRTGYVAINPPNIIISSGLFDQEMVKHVRKIEGVRNAEGTRRLDLRLETTPGRWINLSVKSLTQMDQMQIGRLRLLEGSWPPGDHEIVFDQHKLAEVPAGVGEMVNLEAPSGRVRALKMSGVVQDQTIGIENSGGGYFGAPLQGYVSQRTLEWLEQARPYQFNTLYATVTGDSNDPEYLSTIIERIRDKMEESGITVINSQGRSSEDHPNRVIFEAISVILIMLGLLGVFLSGFLITNTLQALLTQQMTQIGIMKTVGARRFQVATIYLILILIYGLLAFAIALPLSYLAAFTMIEYLAQSTNIVFLGRRLVPQVVAIELFLALLVPQAAAFIPIWQGSRISVVQALSGLQQGSAAGRSRFDRWISSLRRVSRPQRISIRNTFRRKGRLALTLITLTLGGAIFIATFNVRVSLESYIAQISNYFLADVNIVTQYPVRNSEMQELLGDIPGIGKVEAWASARSEMILPDGSPGERLGLLAPPADSPLVKPVMITGRWVLPGDENAIALNDMFLSRYPDLRVGDKIRMRVNDKETDWIIVGFFQLAGKTGGLLAYTNYDYLSQLVGLSNQAGMFRVMSDQPGFKQERLAHAIEVRLKENKIGVYDISTGSRLFEDSAEGFNTLTGFLLFLALLTALVGSIGLAGTMSMNVMERTREIGVMRAIGASNRILMEMVILEGMMIGLISWLFASILAFPISKVMSDNVNMALFDAPANFLITPNGFLIWIVVVLLLSALASYIPARSAARLTIREVLAHE